MLNGAKRTYLSDLKAEDSEESFKDKTLSEHRIPRSTLAVPSSFPETITWKSSRRAKGVSNATLWKTTEGRGGVPRIDRFSIRLFPNPEESGKNRIFQRFDHFAEYINDVSRVHRLLALDLYTTMLASFINAISLRIEKAGMNSKRAVLQRWEDRTLFSGQETPPRFTTRSGETSSNQPNLSSGSRARIKQAK